MKQKKVLAILLAAAMIFSSMQSAVFAQDEGKANPAEDLKKLEEHFKNHDDNDTAITIPYGTGAGEYTNLNTYLEAEAARITGREPSEIKAKYSFAMGTVASDTPLAYSLINKETGDLVQKYNEENKPLMVIGLNFTIEGVTGETQRVYFKIPPKAYTAQEKVDLEADALTWDQIRGSASNKNENTVVVPLGVPQSWGHAKPLPKEAWVFKNEEGVSLKWTCEYTGEGEDPKAFVLKEDGSTSVMRPNVEEPDATYTLTAKFASKKDENVKRDVVFNLRVPAFEAVEKNFRVTPEDAVLQIEDKYYNKTVEEKYITKDGLLRKAKLHLNPEGKAAFYKWTAAKEGYLSQEDTIYHTAGNASDVLEIDLEKSTEDDSTLKALDITRPAKGTAALLKSMENFSKDKTEYNIKVAALDYITLKPESSVKGAEVKLKYYSDKEDADKEIISEAEANGKEKDCYLNTKGKPTVIKMTVKAPEDSIASTKTREYTLTVERDGSKTAPMKSMSLYAAYEDGGSKNTRTVPEEVVSDKEVNEGAVDESYVTTVNCYAKSIEFSLKPVDPENIEKVKVGDEELNTNFLDEYEYTKEGLAVGNNKFTIDVKTKDGKNYTYNMIVRKKPQLNIEKIEVEDGKEGESKDLWIKKFFFAKTGKPYKIKFKTPEGTKIKILDIPGEYTSEDWITLDPKKESKHIFFVVLEKESLEDGKVWKDQQVYLLSGDGVAPEGVSEVDNYLPAPGQFVNTSNWGQNPNNTISGTGQSGVTLGAYGGSICYYLEKPIKDDDKNPYGIDFIVNGNVFRNSDGSSAAAAGEPAAVSVSEDGKKWYELAGSCYFTNDNKGKTKITYRNEDPEFKGAADVPWETDTGLTGKVLKNSHHSQPYYPNPAIYDEYNKGKSKNPTFTKDSLSITEQSFFNESITPRFGYGDTHANGENNVAENPYLSNDNALTNGDGMDLAWAVDGEGKAVSMADKDIHYVKIYSACMADRGAMGEISPEIAGLKLPQRHSEAVGKSTGLKSLMINGEDVELKDNVFAYDFDLKGDLKFKVKATAKNSSSNIIFNNTYIKSGVTSARETAGEAVRIIVQEENKEPLIYDIKFKNKGDLEYTTDLASVNLLPGDIKMEEADANSYKATVDNHVESVLISPMPVSQKAELEINGEILNESNKWKATKPVRLAVGMNAVPLKVKFKDKPFTKDYTLNITRKDSTVTPEDPKLISVKFTLKGTTKHGSPMPNPPIEEWLKTTIYKIPENSTVKYLTDKVLIENDITFATNPEGTYISMIKGLAEKDNGPNSGWMYRHNGKIANEGYAVRKLKDGDEILWFYTDDYKNETGYEGNWDNINAQDKPGDDSKPKEEAIKIETETTKKDKALKIKLSQKSLEESLKKLKNHMAAGIMSSLNIEVGKNVDSVDVSLTKENLKTLSDNMGAAYLYFNTDYGVVAFKAGHISSLLKQGKDLNIVISKVHIRKNFKEEMKVLKLNKLSKPMPGLNIAVMAGGKVLKDVKLDKFNVVIPYDKGPREKAKCIIVRGVKDEEGKQISIVQSLYSGTDKKIHVSIDSSMGLYTDYKPIAKQKKIALKVKKKYKLKLYGVRSKVRYMSMAPKYAEVNSKGLVKALKPGKKVIVKAMTEGKVYRFAIYTKK